MHGLRLVHGDLKGVGFPSAKLQPISHLSTKANILINWRRRACIADFGLSTITGVRTTSLPLLKGSLMSFTSGGTVRWMSPELLDPERFGVQGSEADRPTRRSDCYAMGMVIYEVSFCVDKAAEVFNQDAGIMRTHPIPRHAGDGGHGGDLEWGSTEGTRECSAPWIHQGTVGHHQRVLVGRSRRTSMYEGYFFPSTYCFASALCCTSGSGTRLRRTARIPSFSIPFPRSLGCNLYPKLALLSDYP